MEKLSKIQLMVLVCFLWIFVGKKGYSQCTVDGGVITTDDNTVLCVGDDIDDVINVNLSGFSGTNSIWLITDEAQNIISRLFGQPLGFDDASDGVNLIYHMSYENDANNFSTGNNLDDITGCFDLSNPISVVKNLVTGGVIYDENNTTTRTICLDDPNDVRFSLFLDDQFGENKTWIITDDNGNIIAIQENPFFDLGNAQPGICNIYHLSYENLTNLNTGTNINNLTGCFDLSNPYIVNRSSGTTDAGQISSNSTETLCSGDGIPDIINVERTNAGSGNNRLLVIDDNGMITKIETSTSIDLEGTTSAASFIRNINYIDGIKGLNVGRKLANLEGCFSLSNSISILKDAVDGGSIQSENNKVELNLCVSDNTGNQVIIEKTGAFGSNQFLIITDDQDSIIGLPSSNQLDFTGQPAGICYVYNLSHNMELSGLTIGNTIHDITGCYDLSNRISIVRSSGFTNAGVISTTDETFLCSGDSGQDIINLTVNSAADNLKKWIVTDIEGNIEHLQDSPAIDFTDFSGGVSEIRYIDYLSGLRNLTVGQNIDELEGCFNLSNPITVNRNGVNGGEIQFANGNETQIFCVTGQNQISFQLLVNNEEGSNNTFILASLDGEILSIDNSGTFDTETLISTSYNLYRISFESNINELEVGNSLSDLQGCFSLSNALSLELQNEITTPSVLTASVPDLICAGDGDADVFPIGIAPGQGPNTSWIVIDQGGLILSKRTNSNFDFDQIPGNQNFVIAIKHSDGTQGITVGENITNISGCYSLSNRITINKSMVSGGTIEAINQDESGIIACLGSSEEIVEVAVSGNTGNQSEFLLTDAAGTILKIQESGTFNFAGETPGSVVAWNISYNQAIEGLETGNNINQLNGCFALSNAIPISKERIDGGQIITTENTTEVSICGGEGINDLIEVTLEDVVGNNRTWVLTDNGGNILEFPTGPVFSFEDAPSGICRLYNISYSTNTDNLDVGINLSNLNGCYDLSNAITIRRSLADGGELSINDFNGNVYTSCTGPEQSDIISLSVTGLSGSDQRFILTNSSGRMLRVFSSPSLDLASFGDGLCRIYSVGYHSIENLSTGNNIEELTGCFNLSNSVTINKTEVKGGLLTNEDNQTTMRLCLGDVIEDRINVRLSDAEGSNKRWIITDATDNIISINMNPPFNLENEFSAINKIYNISYEDGIEGLIINKNINQISGCYSLSNPLIVLKDFVLAAANFTTDKDQTETTICTSDGIPDQIVLKAEGAIVGQNTHLIVVDETGLIQDDNGTGAIDFSNYGDGSSFIHQISYANGLIGLEIGQKLEELDGCYDLSTAVRVNRVSGAECSVATFELNGEIVEIEINPNPAYDYINLQLESSISIDSHISVFSIDGKMVLNIGKRKVGDEDIKIDISQLQTGQYILNISTSTGVASLPFIKH